MHEMYQSRQKYDRNVLEISEAKDDVLYFDLSGRIEDDFPVHALSDEQEYAKDFIEFLEKRITG